MTRYLIPDPMSMFIPTSHLRHYILELEDGTMPPFPPLALENVEPVAQQPVDEEAVVQQYVVQQYVDEEAVDEEAVDEEAGPYTRSHFITPTCALMSDL